MRSRVTRVVPVLVAIGLASLLLAAPSMAGGTTTLTASLTGEAERPGPGDENGTGTASIVIDTVNNRVCFSLDWDRIRAPFAAHIHRGSAEVAGPVRVTLFASDVPLPATISGVDGCVEDVSPTLLANMVENPQLFYVNIHNRPFPNGAVRGQLSNPV